MEYKTTYDYFYNKTYSLCEKMIQNSLIESKKNSRSFAFTLEQINKKNNELIVNNCKIKSSKYLIELEKVFKNCLSTYSENSIALTLQNEVFTAFKKLKTSEIPAGYTFKKFSADLGILHGINDVDYRFCEQMDYFKTKYECNQLNDFSIAAIHPEMDSFAPSLDFEQHHKVKHAKTKNSETASLPNNLTSEEKAFLFYILCKALSEPKTEPSSEGFNLPYTELIRLNTIIDFKDKFCFENNYRDSNNYKILTKGIDFFPNTERITFLNILIEKLNDLLLPKTTKNIKELLNKEYNKQVKR